MAKISMMMRELKRAKLVGKYASRRAELKSRILDESLPGDERMAAMPALQKLPRN